MLSTKKTLRLVPGLHRCQVEVYTETPPLRDEGIQIRKVIIGSKKTVSKNKTSIGGSHHYSVHTGIRFIILTLFLSCMNTINQITFAGGKHTCNTRDWGRRLEFTDNLGFIESRPYFHNKNLWKPTSQKEKKKRTRKENKKEASHLFCLSSLQQEGGCYWKPIPSIRELTSSTSTHFLYLKVTTQEAGIELKLLVPGEPCVKMVVQCLPRGEQMINTWNCSQFSSARAKRSFHPLHQRLLGVGQVLLQELLSEQWLRNDSWPWPPRSKAGSKNEATRFYVVSCSDFGAP